MNTLSEMKNDDNNGHTDIDTESPQGETSVDPITTLVAIAQKNPLQIPQSSCSEKIMGKVPNPSVEQQQQFCGVSSSD